MSDDDIIIPEWLILARPYIGASLIFILLCVSSWYLIFGMDRSPAIDETALDSNMGRMELDGPSIMRQACASGHPALSTACEDTFRYIYKAAIIICLMAAIEGICSCLVGKSIWIDRMRDISREVVIVGAVVLSTVILYVFRWW